MSLCIYFYQRVQDVVHGPSCLEVTDILDDGEGWSSTRILAEVQQEDVRSDLRFVLKCVHHELSCSIEFVGGLR